MKLDYSEYPIDFTVPSGNTKRARTLYKGGGGGGDGGAAARKAAEDERIAAGINKLNQVFGMTEADPAKVEREKLYSKIGTDTTNTALTDLNKERAITERELNFMLARSGLSGGSRDVDANKDVLDTHQQGVLKASNLGLQTSNNARSNDEKTRVNLVNSIHAGLSDGDAMAQAYQGMANNSRQAQDDANNASLSGFFNTLRSNQEKAQYNQGLNSVFNTDPNLQIKKYGKPSTGNYDGKTGSTD